MDGGGGSDRLSADEDEDSGAVLYPEDAFRWEKAATAVKFAEAPGRV